MKLGPVTMRGTLEVIQVMFPAELAPALQQSERTVQIENPEMQLKFRRLLLLERLSKLILVGWLAHFLGDITLKAIEKDYQVQGTVWHDWKMKKSGATITLTPSKKLDKPNETDTRPKPL